MPRSSPIDPHGSPSTHPGGEGLGVSQLGGALRRSWAWIALPTLLAFAGSVAFVQIVPPRYTGEAKILLESRDAAFTRSAQERAEQTLPIDEQAVASQVQVVMSRDLAREAIRRLKLVGNAEFDPTVDGLGPVQSALMMLGLVKNPLERAPEDRALETYFDRLLVYPAGKSRILTVEFRSKDAELAARAANTVAEIYIASLEAAKVDTARYASTWLGGNIDALRMRVSEAEAKVEAFRSRNGLIAGGGLNTATTLGAQQLGELSTQLSQARTTKADLAGRAKLIKEMIKDGRAFEIPDVANNEIIRRAVEQRIGLRGQLALESRTLLPAHPRIKELTAQVSDLDGQIKATAERVVRTMENDAKIAAARVESLTAAVDSQRETVAKGNSSEVQLRALEREAKAQRDQLESYLSRYREAAARDAESAAPADARVISRAITPETPSFPKKLPIIGLVTLLALLFAVGAVVARHLLTDPEGGGRRRPEERDGAVEADAQPHAPLFSATEASFQAPRRVAQGATQDSAAAAEAADPPSRRIAREPPAFLVDPPEALSDAPAAPIEATVASIEATAAIASPTAPQPEPATRRDEPYALDLLIGRLGDAPRGGGGRRVLVAETEPGDSLALILAQTLSGSARALLVDLDGPACGPDEAGLTDLVAGEAAFLDVIQPTPGSRLHQVPRGFLDVAVLAEEPQALAIGLDAMAQTYDWVICRLSETRSPQARDLMALVAELMGAVVIASNAQANDEGLVALYNLAQGACAGRILVAQDRAARDGSASGHAAESVEDAPPLRRSAA